MRSLFTECKTCGVRFNWTISDTDPVCERCTILSGNDPRKILNLLSENKVPGQKDLLRILEMISDRLDRLENLIVKK